jgi:transcriptional regulator with PAS, ATPase and Fis domain
MARKTRQMTLIEQQQGKPIEDVLRALYTKHKNQAAMANELGITQGTLSIWLMRLNLVEHRTLVKGS